MRTIVIYSDQTPEKIINKPNFIDLNNKKKTSGDKITGIYTNNKKTLLSFPISIEKEEIDLEKEKNEIFSYFVVMNENYIALSSTKKINLKNYIPNYFISKFENNLNNFKPKFNEKKQCVGWKIILNEDYLIEIEKINNIISIKIINTKNSLKVKVLEEVSAKIEDLIQLEYYDQIKENLKSDIIEELTPFEVELIIKNKQLNISTVILSIGEIDVIHAGTYLFKDCETFDYFTLDQMIELMDSKNLKELFYDFLSYKIIPKEIEDFFDSYEIVKSPFLYYENNEISKFHKIKYIDTLPRTLSENTFYIAEKIFL